ncbi:RraA family protein [Gordonia sp. KTR9]|uniref:RraA family protein n=1 Tax=Gordonia sp. KTR9 TaxID=337191 RepID=UPI00027DE657|nr:RraA family protein [Gordonia sp. KTR9]AFR49804.1 Demethylmenaquinone methyltransferase [Gordonia sp. KTR9]
MSTIPERARRPGNIDDVLIATEHIQRHGDDLSRRLLVLPDMSSAVADALDELCVGAVIAASVLTPVSPDSRICGPAITLRYGRLDADASGNRVKGRGLQFGDRDLYGLGSPGDVAVMDCSGATDAAVVGGLSAMWAQKAGIAGCVVDGAIRDTDSIQETGHPTWSQTRTPRAARYRYQTLAINSPIVLQGNVVRPGDYIVADRDGICVIPFHSVPDVVDHCEDAQLREDWLAQTIHAAPTLEDLIETLGSAAATTPT